MMVAGHAWLTRRRARWGAGVLLPGARSGAGCCGWSSGST